MNIDNTETITVKKGRSTFKYTDFDMAFAKLMHDRIRATIPYTPHPNLESWADTLRKMRTIDEIPATEAGNVFRWANQDNFWKANILSPKNLRKHFGRLRLLMLANISDQELTKNRSVTQQLSDRSWASNTMSESSEPTLTCDSNDISWVELK